MPFREAASILTQDERFLTINRGILINLDYVQHMENTSCTMCDCGECLEVLLDDEWVQTRMEMNPAREWYLVGTPYCGDLEYIRARIPG